MDNKGFSAFEMPAIVFSFLAFSIIAAVVLGILVISPESSQSLQAKTGGSDNDAVLGALLKYEYEGKEIGFIIKNGGDVNEVSRAVHDFFDEYPKSWKMKISVKQNESESYYTTKYLITDLQTGTYDSFFGDFEETAAGVLELAYVYLPGDYRVDFVIMDKKIGGAA